MILQQHENLADLVKEASLRVDSDAVILLSSLETITAANDLHHAASLVDADIPWVGLVTGVNAPSFGEQNQEVWFAAANPLAWNHIPIIGGTSGEKVMKFDGDIGSVRGLVGPNLHVLSKSIAHASVAAGRDHAHVFVLVPTFERYRINAFKLHCMYGSRGYDSIAEMWADQTLLSRSQYYRQVIRFLLTSYVKIDFAFQVVPSEAIDLDPLADQDRYDWLCEFQNFVSAVDDMPMSDSKAEDYVDAMLSLAARQLKPLTDGSLHYTFLK